MKKLVLETTAPFQGLPELVAHDEGLFAREGLAIEWADREKDVDKKTEINVISPKGLDPFSSHGKLLEQGQDWAVWRPDALLSQRIENEIRAISGLRIKAVPA